ncbi:MAG: archease [Dehalococcoidia bacterium]|nr:archease [Dehalococcoidia bacterium]
MGADFEVIEHTADIGIVAHGSTLEETFAAAARGMFSIMVDLDDIRPEISRDIDVRASDLELLLVEWLSELLFIFETEYLLFSRFEVSTAAEGQLRARAWGERINQERHHIGTGIKAVTRHLLSLERRDGYRATVIFDV